MSARPPGSVTQLLAAAGGGDAAAASRLWTLLYDELRGMARRQLASEPAGKVRQTTSLVNEVFLRLVRGQPIAFANRRHFFASAAQAMRRILVDDARRRNRQKRGGGARPVSLRFDSVGLNRDPDEVLAVHEALDRLSALDARKARVVEYRYFAGLSGEETAKLLGLSARTVDSEWRFARAWLRRELSKDGDRDNEPIGST